MKKSVRAFGGFMSAGLVLGSLFAVAPGCSGSAQPVAPQPAPIDTAPAHGQAQNQPVQPPAPTAPPQPAPTAQTPPTPTATVTAQPAPAPTPTVQVYPAPPAPTTTAQPPPGPTTTPQPQPAKTSQAPKFPPIQKIGVTPASCVIKGTAPPPRDMQLFDLPVGGRVIGKLSGNNAPLALREIPKDPTADRSRLTTSMGSGAVRINGYVQTSALPLYTTRDIPVMAGNVSITSAQKVKLVIATAASVTVELTVAGSRNQNVRSTTTCDALTLQRGTPVPMSPPGNGRAYLTKEATTEIFGQPNGDIVFSLQMLEGSSQVFWSTESRAGFVHVQSRSDLTIDGWVRAAALDPVKKGEMVDQYIPPQSVVTGAQLVMEKGPRLAKATKEIVIRPRRDEKERPIGVVEPGAEFFVMETSAGWTNVLPKDLYVLPPDDGGFWVLASDVPAS